MGPVGRRARAGASVVLAVLVVAGTAWGRDDHFPFAPMKMFAHAHHPDGWVSDTWAYGRDASGREIRLDESVTGVRPAEVEGQIGRFQDDPSRLRTLAAAYDDRHPGHPPLVSVEIRTRRVEMRAGAPTGAERTVVRARWER